jgi:hypothetical protein
VSKTVVDTKTAFLHAFIACADLTQAAKKVKIDRGTHYEWLRNDPEYPARYAQARVEAGQTLKDDAVHWARVGVFEQYTFQGRPQFAHRLVRLYTLPDGREIRASELPEDQDALKALDIQSTRVIEEDDPRRPLGQFRRSEGLMGRMLKAFIPAEFGDRSSIELSGPGGGPIPLEDERLKKLSDDELAQLIAIAKKLTPDSGDGGGSPPAPAK